MLALLLIWSCDNKQQSVSIDNLIVGKWKIVEYGSGYVNALDTLGFYKNGKADCPPETGEFTYRLIKPDSLIIYNKSFGEQHFKIIKLSNDSLIRRISRQKIYADSIDELVNGEIEKYIRVTNE
jgi:hypothetical protein